jgi:DNA-binding transcriptional ArsR family regulator
MTYEEALHALGDPTRRAILELLRDGPSPVGRLAARLPVSRPAVSQHLRVLERARLVEARREGTRRYYGVRREGLEPLRVYIESFWDDLLGAFKNEAEKEKERKEKERP